MQQRSEAIDQQCYVGAVFFDLCKAFDRVWHSGLLAKLQKSGVSGEALKWFQSFLVGHRQAVTVDGSVSDFVSLHAGVPQGTIRRPLFFSIYIDDICTTVSENINLFADDTSLYVTDRSAALLPDHLQRAIDGVSHGSRHGFCLSTP